MPKPLERLPPLDLLGTFEAVARHSSITKAGDERFVTQSAVSRQIKLLEENLGVDLFERKHRSLQLTEDGRRLYETCADMLQQLRGTVARIRSPGGRQVLSLTTTPGLATLWLIPRLPEFTKTNPHLDLRLDVSLVMHDLKADGFDVAIRYGRANGMQGRPLFRETMLPVCSPQLARDASLALSTPADLRLHTLLQVTVPHTSGVPLEWDPWLQAVGLSDLRPAATVSFTLYDQAIAAAIAGQGVALGRLPLVERLLKAGALIAPFEQAVESPREHSLIVNPESQSKPAVQVFEVWLMHAAQR
jgi:DNA-binding transcriptional LysR family regulator